MKKDHTPAVMITTMLFVLGLCISLGSDSSTSLGTSWIEAIVSYSLISGSIMFWVMTAFEQHKTKDNGNNQDNQ